MFAKTLRYYLLFVVFYAGLVNAQEQLKLEDAIRIAITNNVAVKTASNNTEIAKAQNNPGASGLTPTVSFNGSASGSVLNSNQVFNTGATQDRSGAKSNGLNASLNADWMVFDGMRMFAVKKRLALNEEASMLSYKLELENTIYNVMIGYYDVVRINELLKASKENIRLYQERKKIADLRLQIGADSKVESMLANSDLNRAISSQYQLELALLNAKATLNNLLMRSATTDFLVTDSINVTWQPEFEDLKKQAGTTNTSMLLAKQNERISAQNLLEARSGNMPFITVNGAYVFTRTQSQAGFLYSNRQNGLNFGLTARWLLYSGGKNTRLQTERSLQALNQKLYSEELSVKIDAQVYFQFQSLLLNQKIASLEQMNVREAVELQQISLERFKTGKATIIETLETQKNLEEAQSRYITALYNAKVAEANLLKTNGSLVK